MKTTLTAQGATREEVIKDGNSTVNQQIKGKLVGREVNMCLSYLMQELFKASNMISSRDVDLPQLEDVENFYSYPEWNKTVVGEDLYFQGGTESKKDEFLKEFDRLEEESAELLEKEEISETTHDRNVEQINEAREEFEGIENEPQEVYEWWAVDEMLFNNLRDKGEPVLEYANMYIWGRTCSGQAILLDHVITEIAADMEILEGQAHDWSRK